jgi:hypothetical protein
MKKIILLIMFLFGLVLVSGWAYGDVECHLLMARPNCSFGINLNQHPELNCSLYCNYNSQVKCMEDYQVEYFMFCKDSTEACDPSFPCGGGEGEGEVPEFSSAFAVIAFIIIALAVFWFIKKKGGKK